MVSEHCVPPTTDTFSAGPFTRPAGLCVCVCVCVCVFVELLEKQILAELRNFKHRICDEVNAIVSAMLLCVMESAFNRQRQCSSLEGYLTGVIFKK